MKKPKTSEKKCVSLIDVHEVFHERWQMLETRVICFKLEVLSLWAPVSPLGRINYANVASIGSSKTAKQKEGVKNSIRLKFK